MTGSPHARARARAGRPAAARAGIAAVLLCVLLAALPALRHAPAAPGAVLAWGLSIEWWYGGLLAPVAAWVVAIWGLRTLRDPGPVGARLGAADEADVAPAAPADGSG